MWDLKPQYLGPKPDTIKPFLSLYPYMGGCQDYGPCGVPIIIQHLVFRVPQKGTIILTTTILPSHAFIIPLKPQKLGFWALIPSFKTSVFGFLDPWAFGRGRWPATKPCTSKDAVAPSLDLRCSGLRFRVRS